MSQLRIYSRVLCLAMSATILFSCEKSNSDDNHHNGIADSPVTDIDGNVYRTVRIGNQVWMAENLKVTRYRNGDPIYRPPYNSTWRSTFAGAFCYYNNSEDNKSDYGALYNFFAIADSRGIAPEGWHVPSEAELQTLLTTLGTECVAGGKLKEIGTDHWLAPNTGATDDHGFSAVAGGLRHYDGSFAMLKMHATFWTSSETNSSQAWAWDMYFENSGFSRFEFTKKTGFSVRCIKD